MEREGIHANVGALVTELSALAARSRALKSVLWTTWTEPMADVQRELVGVRRRTTELCILRAWLRGRHHLRAPLREGAFPGMTWDAARFHRTVAERVARDFPAAMEAAS